MSKRRVVTLSELKKNGIFENKRLRKSSDDKEKRNMLLDSIIDRMAERSRQKRLAAQNQKKSNVSDDAIRAYLKGRGE